MGVGPGSLLGTNIVLERQIGAGAMGTVWLAQNRALGSPVAVKVLQAALALDDQAFTRFQQEARAVASIDSPHVVKVFDFGVTPEREPYIVMELLRGSDLREVLERGGPMAPQRTAHVVGQVCRALARAHALGVVHRDIKPANLFLVDGEGEPFVKVLDFGIARFGGDTNMAMTQTGAALGTPYYMSPEQFFEPRSVDARSDLWSVAVVAYCCLLGRLPFGGESIGALSLAVHRGAFVPPSQIDARLPRALDAFFHRAFHASPDGRYGSALELCAAFSAAASGSEELADTALAPVRHVAGPPGNAPAVTLGAFAQASFPGAPKVPVPRSSPPWPWIALAAALLGSGILGGAVLLSRTADQASVANDDETDSEADSKPKKKKRKRTEEEAPPKEASPSAPSPPPTAAPTPAPPGPSTATPTAPASAKTAAPSTTAPKHAAPARLYTGTACRAFSNDSCPSVADCCPGRGPRDTTQWAPPRPGKDFAECKCMRPQCGPGENWSTHQCMVKK